MYKSTDTFKKFYDTIKINDELNSINQDIFNFVLNDFYGLSNIRNTCHWYVYIKHNENFSAT